MVSLKAANNFLTQKRPRCDYCDFGVEIFDHHGDHRYLGEKTYGHWHSMTIMTIGGACVTLGGVSLDPTRWRGSEPSPLFDHGGKEWPKHPPSVEPCSENQLRVAFWREKILGLHTQKGVPPAQSVGQSPSVALSLATSASRQRRAKHMVCTTRSRKSTGLQASWSISSNVGNVNDARQEGTTVN